jgi:hypothetical protein
MSDEVIDEAILAALSEIPGHWRKVRMVVSKVASTMGDGLANGHAGYEAVARSIEFLVSEGRLVGRGTLRTGVSAKSGCQKLASLFTRASVCILFHLV